MEVPKKTGDGWDDWPNISDKRTARGLAELVNPCSAGKQSFDFGLSGTGSCLGVAESVLPRLPYGKLQGGKGLVGQSQQKVSN